MKIAIVTPVYPPYHGGIGAVAAAHAAVLRGRGHEVMVYTPRYYSTKEAAPEGVVLLPPLLRYGNAAFIPSLARHVRGADIIHVHYPFFGGAEVIHAHRRSLKAHGSKIIMHYHMDVAGVGFRKVIFDFHAKLLMPAMMKKADAVIATSQDYFDHSLLAPLATNLRERLTIIPNGVDTKTYYPASSRTIVQEALGFKEKEKIILFVGGLDPAHYFKGVEYLIEAVSRLRDAAYSWRLVIVGEGSLRQRYEDLVSQLRLEHRVTFAGRVNDVDLPLYYQAANVTVLPSIDRSEAFGMVLIESLACGTPVIASDLPGVRSVVSDSVGILAKPRDVDSLAGSINTILSDDILAQRLGSAGVTEVQKQYDWEIIGNQLESLYTKLRL